MAKLRGKQATCGLEGGWWGKGGEEEGARMTVLGRRSRVKKKRKMRRGEPGLPAVEQGLARKFGHGLGSTGKVLGSPRCG